jgi:hypothetical protein
MTNLKLALRTEKSINNSGTILNKFLIPKLKEEHYYIVPQQLDGDAPKQFIKAYTYQQDSHIRKRNLKTWVPYIAKTGEKWYPHESIVEFMINRIGQELNLNMNDIGLYEINGQVRFLSKYFLHKNEALTHGAEICGEYLNDIALAEEIANEKKTSRELFTFEFIEKAIKAKFGSEHNIIMEELVKMVTFDALVGNNDRHFYNWGVITPLKKTKNAVKFAPLYDSARGLLWNISDAKVIKYLEMKKSNGKQIENYIRNACPRISIEGNSEINHFDLVKYLKREKGYASVIDRLSSTENENKVLDMLNKELFPLFIKDRSILITYILTERFRIIREV